MESFDVVRVPFPYSDYPIMKTRPALVISSSVIFNIPSDHVVTLMITSAARSSFPLDIPLQYYSDAGLLKPSIIRMKFFTPSQRIILEKIGSLHFNDRQNVVMTLRNLLFLSNHRRDNI